MIFGFILLKFLELKRRESFRNRSQIVAGSVGDVYDALARVSALSGLQNPQKFTGNTSIAADVGCWCVILENPTKMRVKSSKNAQKCTIHVSVNFVPQQ